METDDNRKLYELQEYDNVGGFPERYQGEVKIHEKPTGGRIQFVIMIIQLVLLVLLLGAAIVILYQLNTNTSSDTASAPVTSNDNVLTDLANTSTGTQYAVREVSQIMLAEIERRLNDTATLNRLAQTTDLTTQSIADVLSAIVNVASLANATNGAVDTSTQSVLNAIFDVHSVANITSNGVYSANEKLSNLMTAVENILIKIGANFAEEREYQFNNTELLNRLLNGTSASASKLMNIVNTLSNLQDTSASTAGVADDILLIAQELLELHNESAALPTSCKQLQEQQPLSPSGYYILAGPTGTYSTYCNMGTLCGSGGGWTRLAYLDMSDSTQNCPSGFRLYQSGGVRACGRPGSGCTSVQFPSNGISYSQICGRVTGYQYGHTDGLHSSYNIDTYYLEGVSITRGSPRQHVWTLIAGYTQLTSNACPCNTGSTVSVQSFIGNNYFCESGNPSSSTSTNRLYTSDPLWDGQSCGSRESPCCSASGLPWFHRDYGSSPTTDFIELRVCGDANAAGSNGEDSPVGYYEIYVK